MALLYLPFAFILHSLWQSLLASIPSHDSFCIFRDVTLLLGQGLTLPPPSVFYTIEGYYVIAAFAVLAIMFFSLLIGGISDDSITPTSSQSKNPSLQILSNFVYGMCDASSS